MQVRDEPIVCSGSEPQVHPGWLGYIPVLLVSCGILSGLILHTGQASAATSKNNSQTVVAGSVDGPGSPGGTPSATGGPSATNTPTATPTVVPSPPPVFLARRRPPDLSPIFAPEVLHWKEDILRWSKTYDLDPNLVATVMQLESCGNPQAVSVTNAQGLFQVLTRYFRRGEDPQDVETNADRGLRILREDIARTRGNVSAALASYNHGPAILDVAWSDWPEEPQLYYKWGTLLYQTASSRPRRAPDYSFNPLCRKARVVLQLPQYCKCLATPTSTPTSMPITLAPEGAETITPDTTGTGSIAKSEAETAVADPGPGQRFFAREEHEDRQDRAAKSAQAARRARAARAKLKLALLEE